MYVGGQEELVAVTELVVVEHEVDVMTTGVQVSELQTGVDVTITVDVSVPVMQETGGTTVGGGGGGG